MVHVGVDLDKRSSQIAVLTEEGEISQQRLPNDPVRLEKFFAELPPHTPVAIEASTQLARFRETRVVHNEALPRALWDLAEDLSISAGDMRKQLVVNDGESDGLFCHWDDTTGMQIWRLLTAIKAASEAVEEAAYWFTRILEDVDQPPDDVSEPNNLSGESAVAGDTKRSTMNQTIRRA
jgi:hypothetical protein